MLLHGYHIAAVAKKKNMLIKGVEQNWGIFWMFCRLEQKITIHSCEYIQHQSAIKSELISWALLTVKCFMDGLNISEIQGYRVWYWITLGCIEINLITNVSSWAIFKSQGLYPQAFLSKNQMRGFHAYPKHWSALTMQRKGKTFTSTIIDARGC